MNWSGMGTPHNKMTNKTKLSKHLENDLGFLYKQIFKPVQGQIWKNNNIEQNLEMEIGAKTPEV